MTYVYQGRGFILVVFVVLSGAIFYRIRLARTGKVPYLRKLAGVSAIEEAVGRATELGRPIVFSPGIAGLGGEYGAQTFAALEILGYVARTAAKYDTRIIVGIRIPEVLPIAEEIVRSAFAAEGKLDRYNPDDVRFLSQAQFAYAAGVMGIMERERPGATFLIGGFWAESLMFAEVGNSIGALQIAGTANLHQIQFFVAACDYTLLGEEMFAVGAYFSGDPVKKAIIAGQDFGKIIAIFLIVAGTLFATFGLESIVNRVINW
ncbi:MAG: hypothetical protein IMF26_00255 [Candidatus Fermentithermobacillus carboniphilus]|uniref:DUF6754 domain-containing protein n=1 Tax=Candidatus Fermentithermobacillus carboniphilus TaxID=3085328 RepID=A0AAT9LCQ8_9FIRM|nr:MAG: hypothetical protein IMF26_00255 [Candidatus Fermentithermobacillus carboniphilus]